MNYKRLLIMLAFVFISQRSSAFIYEIKVLRKWDASHNRYHYFIGCSDFHDKSHQANQDQLKKIEQLLADSDKGQIKLVVEDLSSTNTNGRNSCGRFFVNSRGGVLGGLSEKSIAMGVDTNNIEFRYCRVTSCGPVLNNLTVDTNNFASTRMTTVQNLVQEINDIINEIKSYDDGAALKVVYDGIMAEVQKQLKELHLDKHQDLQMSQYLKTHTNAESLLGLLKNILTFDSGLLDIRLVHACVNSMDKAKVVAIAGGAHIGRTCEILEKNGYTQAMISKVNFSKEHDLQKCLGSHIIEGAFCMKPDPIELNMLQDALGMK